MSARELRRSARTRPSGRRNGLELDLNDLPPEETSVVGGDPHEFRTTHQQIHVQAPPPPPPPLPRLPTLQTLPAAIDVEAIDDEVVISSPRSFAEARSKARRNRGNLVTLVLDDDAEDQGVRVEQAHSRLTLNGNKKRRGPMCPATNFDLYINVDGVDSSKRANNGKHSQPPKEPTFSCPVCMCQLSEETSTKCGHIFCKKCIKASITAQSKCPTCRRKLTMKDTFRVYLPTTTTG